MAICLKYGSIVFYLFLFWPTLGPPLPKRLSYLSMLEVQGDLYVFGGQDKFSKWHRKIYKFSCSRGECAWSTIKKTLKIERHWLVAIHVPESFCMFENK